MAYSLRYWYNNKLTDGKVIRLEIYKKDSTAAAMEIGDVVQGISLNIDGGEDNIDAPIVSTSLVMTFCDAYDHPEAEVKKCGNYAEFYTPDATLWKVVLLCKDAGASSFRTLWGGYVTPDSYEEDLTYRGSVTIVARDNIGHMADFPFDAEGDGYGTISFREILEGAWAKIESPMSLIFHDEWMQTEGVSALDTRMNVTAFEDKSWHEAVEAALYAYGAVLRFIGDNEVKVSPLRYMPNYGGSVTHSEPVFMTGATRLLTPAVKRIEETASYELEAGAVIPRLEASDYTGEVGTYRFQIKEFGGDFGTTEGIFTAPVWPVQKIGLDGWIGGVAATTLFFNIDAYELSDFAKAQNQEDEIKRYMYIGANNVDFGFVRLYKTFNCSDFAIHIKLGKPISMTDDMKLQQSSSFNLQKIVYRVGMEQNGVTNYFQGGESWAAADTDLTQGFDPSNPVNDIVLPVSMGANIGEAKIFFDILKVEYVQVSNGGTHTGIYACIQSLSFDVPESISLLQTNRVNTNFNEENNVIITRDPAIAPAYNTTFLPSVIKNGIFYAEGLAYKPAKAWAFDGDTPQQMAVYNHLQLLAYYAKPNNVIEGSIVNGDVSRFAHIWQFEGKEHILVSGRYNFINGYIEGAILREFARYESLWGSTGGTQLPATETSSETNIEASASSSSSANTYENTTVVNIGTGGGGSGASYLGDLKDVDTTAVVGGSVLYFNGTQWVDKTLQMILNELKQLGDWFYKTEDGKSIGTKYNLFSEGEMSANGLNLGGGTSGGGGLIQNVLGKSAFGTVASEDNATTFNAFAIDSLYKRIVELEGKDVEVDLSDYYTKQQTQNAITSALSPYIKATDADGKYAALASFNALQSSFDRLYSALNDDTSGVINTWNEVVDFVNEYSGSEDLSTILGKMNTDINARVKVSDFDSWKTDVFNPLSVTVTNLGNKVNDHTDKINKILSWFELREDEDLLITTHNLASYKEISSNGISQGTGGGGSGLISSVLGVGSLGATLTNDNSVVFNAYATNEIYKTTQGHASRIGVLESQVGQLTTQSTKVSVSDLLTTGTKIATITVDGVPHEVKGDFLPTSGGTITGGAGVLEIKRNGPYLSSIKFSNTDGELGELGFVWANNPAFFHRDGNYYPLYHTGNFNPANYLPLSGGTLTKVDSNPLIIKRTGSGGPGVEFYADDTRLGSLGIGTDYAPFFYNANKGQLYDLIHSGNVGSQIVEGITTHTGEARNASGDIAKLNSYYSSNGFRISRFNGLNGLGTKNSDGLIINWPLDYAYGQQWYMDDESHTIQTRYVANNAWSDWKTIAFTDSNVASAQALVHSNGTKGAEVNERGELVASKNILINNATSILAKSTSSTNLSILTIDSSDTLLIGYGMNGVGGTTIFGNGVAMRYGASRTMGFLLNSSGNVTIGSSDKAGATAKLYVDGSVYVGNKNVLDRVSNNLHIGEGIRGSFDTSIFGTNILFNTSSGNYAMMIAIGGNVLIGTTTDSGYKLDVNGNINAAGSIISKHGMYLNRDTSALYGLFAGPIISSVSVDSDIWLYTPTTLNLYGASVRIIGAATFNSTLTIAGATTHNGIAYFGGATYYINTSGNANFNAISGDSLSVATLTVSGASSFASKTTHNGGIGAAWVSISGTLEVGTTSTFAGETTHNGGIKTTAIETASFLATGSAKIHGELRLQKGSNANGNYLYFGDGSLCYLHEEIDDRLTIYAQKGLVTKAATGTAWDSITKENWIDDNSAHTRFVNNYNALAIIIDKDYGASYRRAAIQVGDTSNNVGTLYLNPKGGEVHVGSTLHVSTIDAGSTLYLQASTITNQAKWWSLDATGNFYTLGNIAAEGEISANALNQGSDIRFKHQLGDITLDLDTIANAPMFRFTWTNKENSRVQIGTSAQYWKDSARELVSVDKDDFHRLDYATLGVLIGVTLGKTVKNHEDRIKELEREVVELKEENRRLRYEC